MTTVSDIQKQAEAQGLPDANPAAIAFTLGFAAGLRAKQQRKLRRLVCQPQNYAWGRLGLQSKVAQMMEAAGLEVDPALPYAEYWFGTHAAAPSSVVVSEEEEGGRGASSEDGHGESPSSSSVALLSQWLVDTPSALGRLAEGEAARTGQLPFLLKVLSVAKALSIQAHPDKALAERLHAARPDVYKDDNHKPEMAVALTDFEAMCGFRPYSEIAQHLTTDYPELGKLVGDAIVQEFVASTDSSEERQQAALKALFTAWMKCGEAELAEHLGALLERLTKLQADNDAELTPLQQLLLRLSDQYPGDVGIFAPIILNYLQLKPGQAIFLAANEPHAYLAGDIVECMACSNNVVRAGLTPKLRDVDTLCDMLTYKCYDPKELLVRPQVRGHCRAYVPPIDEFVITCIDLEPGQSQVLDPQSSPCLLLVMSGEVSLSGKHISAGATFMETPSTDPAAAITASVVGDAPVQLYRVYAKDTF